MTGKMEWSKFRQAYIERIREVGSVTEEIAQASAEMAKELYEAQENPNPETLADEEVACWGI